MRKKEFDKKLDLLKEKPGAGDKSFFKNMLTRNLSKKVTNYGGKQEAGCLYQLCCYICICCRKNGKASVENELDPEQDQTPGNEKDPSASQRLIC